MSSSRRVLIVDDDPNFTAMLRLNLEHAIACDVREENDSRHVVKAAMDFQPGIIFLDVMMPHLDGGGVLAALEVCPATRAIPVIFLTALVSEDEADVAGLPSGGRRFLPKLLSLPQLLECIEEACIGEACIGEDNEARPKMEEPARAGCS